jgi:hypothetical protein
MQYALHNQSARATAVASDRNTGATWARNSGDGYTIAAMSTIRSALNTAAQGSRWLKCNPVRSVGRKSSRHGSGS